MLNTIRYATHVTKTACSEKGAVYIRTMSAIRTTRYKGKAAQQYANDGKGTHTHVLKDKCVLPNCDKMKCVALCSTESDTDVLGHNTHKPPVGRIARFVADEDANGDPKKQYFVKTNKKVSMTPNDKQKHAAEMKPDPKQDTFVKKHKDKYED